MECCIRCNKNISHDEIALHKKLFNRGADKYMCKECISEYFNVSVKMLDEKIEQYKKDGCTLFEAAN